MKTLSHKSHRSKTGETYLSLVQKFPLRPIRNDAEHDLAMDQVRHLAIWAEGTLSPGEQDYLDALLVFLEDYNRSAKPWARSTGLELLKHLVSENAFTVAQLGKIVGSQPLASLILSAKRGISKEVARRLGAHFRLDYRAFL